MKPTGRLRAYLVILYSTIILSFAGCATDTAPDGSTGSLSLDLTVAGDFEIDEVAWTIRGGDMPSMSGTVDTSASGSSASVVVFGIPAGSGYTIDMQATSTDGELSCEGSAGFDIEAEAVTDVHVMLNCSRPDAVGGVNVDVDFNLCAALTKVVVSPLQTSVGSRIDLQSAAADDEGDTVAYQWTSQAGYVREPAAADTTYTCTEAGEDRITISVSDDEFDHCMSQWTVEVTCMDSEAFDFKVIDVPGGASERAEGVNNLGQIVGSYTVDGTDRRDIWVKEPNGAVHTYELPTGRSAQVHSINDLGQVAGLSTTVDDADTAISFGWVYNIYTEEYLEFNYAPPGDELAPDAAITEVTNDGQTIVGWYDTTVDQFEYLGLVDSINGGNLTTIDGPSDVFTFVWGTNDSGVLVGRELRSGFTSNDGISFDLFQVDGNFTTAFDINNAGTVVGSYFLPGFASQFGFIRDQGELSSGIAISGAVRTSISGINDGGLFVGSFTDGDGNTHAFYSSLSQCNGASEIELAYSELTANGHPMRYLLDANDLGRMVGSVPSDTAGALDGFIRSPDGSAQFWSTPDRLVFPTAINNAGTVVGTKIPLGGGLPEGFRRDAAGHETPYSFSDALGTVPFGISNDDTVSGFYVTPTGRRGFVARASTGLSRSVEYPGAAETQLFGINDAGQAGGAYYDATGAAFPFIYDIAHDRFQEIAPPTSGNFVVTSLNNSGDAIVFGLRDVAENYADLRSFFRDGKAGTMTELFYPGAVETYGYDIDNDGRIIGYFLDSSGGYGGFRAIAADCR